MAIGDVACVVKDRIAVGFATVKSESTTRSTHVRMRFAELVLTISEVRERILDDLVR